NPLIAQAPGSLRQVFIGISIIVVKFTLEGKNMVTERDQEMAADKAAEKANDAMTEGSPLKEGELTSAYKNRVDALHGDQKQRVLDYIEDKVRDTASYRFLKDLRLSLVDEQGTSLTRKPARAESSGTKGAAQPEAASSSGEKVEARAAARSDAG